MFNLEQVGSNTHRGEDTHTRVMIFFMFLKVFNGSFLLLNWLRRRLIIIYLMLQLSFTSLCSYHISKWGCYILKITCLFYTVVTKTCQIQFSQVKGWMDEDLVNYHLKELHCSTQCHTNKVDVDKFKRLFRDLFQQHQILYIVLQSIIVQA